MAVLWRICGVTRRDRKRNIDIMNLLDIDEVAVELLRETETNILDTFLVCSRRDTHTPSFMDTSPEDQGRSG